MGKFLATQNSESAPCLTFHVKAAWEYTTSPTAKATTPPLMALRFLLEPYCLPGRFRETIVVARSAPINFSMGWQESIDMSS
jgi:hypothetical protein